MGVTTSVALVTTLGGCATGDLKGVGAENRADPRNATVSASPPVGSATSGADLAAVTEVLRTRVAAIVAGDERAFGETVADRASSEGLRQLAVYSAARALRVSHLDVGTVSDVRLGTSTTSSELRVRAPLTYRIDDLDRADRTSEVSVLMRRDGTGGWSVVSETAVAAGAPPWVVMPGLAVRRGEHAVVAGTVPPAALAHHAEVVDRALPDLRRDWSGTPDRVLVLAPGTAAEADALLGRSPGSGAAPVAATTEGPTGADGRATGDHVVLDPTAFTRLTAAGRDVVLTHELAHVAVRASVAGRAATWLAEGYADHVGYTRADVSVQRLLAPLLAEVRAGRGPADLPGPVELDPGAGAIEVPYLAAWQAVELLADEHGEDALRRLVVAASATGSDAEAEAATDRALGRVLGTSRAELTRAWQQRLRDLAR